MKIIITILRMAIGWHFLYEGCVKLFAENWTSEGYLAGSQGFLSGFFHWLAASQGRLEVVDILNVAGLILIGLSLSFGLLGRWASLAGAFLLTLYYLAYPPFGLSLLSSTEGSVFIINKLLIEAVVLVFLFAHREQGYGLDGLAIRLFRRRKTRNGGEERAPEQLTLHGNASRREALKNLATLPVLGLMGWRAYRNTKKYGIDVMSGATVQVNWMMLSELEGELPKGRIGGHELGRLIMGGNLIGGWAHARDLLYAGSLFKAYNTETKIYETLMLCEQAGINAINIGFPTIPVMVKYRKLTGSKMKVITQVGIREKSEDLLEDVTVAIDSGMDII
ncbi:MAG: DoxX family protein [Tannerella sp.]|jgi:uncharacterized membrane protein YphA (DoxX/SURF4 family)|nr:DoxX family protein [Tannerella sp.]